MSTLYEIVDDMAKIAELIEAAEGDENLKAALDEAMDESEAAMTDKITSIVKLIRIWEGQSDQAKAEMDRLKTRKQTLDNQSKRLRTYLQYQARRLGLDKIDTPVGLVSIRQGSESVVVDDEWALPQGYFTTKTSVSADKRALKALWDATPEDERPEDWGFHVERGEPSVQIR